VIKEPVGERDIISRSAAASQAMTSGRQLHPHTRILSFHTHPPQPE
jgi:hypothetical protein